LLTSEILATQKSTHMKSITAFETTDGRIFAKMDDAQKHQMFLSQGDVVESFLGSESNPYTGHAHMTMARNTIINWEHWKVTNETK
jgi:hypothetical protein